jgi:hypothetical protein
MVHGLARYRESSRHELRRIEREWLDGLSHRDGKLLHAMNPWAGGLWSDLLAQAFEEVAPDEPAWAVTVLDHRWDRLVDNYSVVTPADVKLVLDRMRKRLFEAFRGMSYLFMVDVSVERQARAKDNPRLLSLHLHGVVWGDREEVRAKKRYFAGGHYGAPALRTQTITDCDGWLRYACRDQRLGNYWWKDLGGESYGRRNEPIYSGQRLHLLRMFRHVTKPDLCLASGVGLEIRRHALGAAKERGYVIPARGADWSLVFPCHALSERPLNPSPSLDLSPDPSLDPYYD